MLDLITWLVTNIVTSVQNLFMALLQPNLWLAWIGGLDTVEDKQSLMRFIYYGGSVEFFFVVLTAFLILTVVGLWKNSILWGVVRGLETFANTIGRIAAWAGLIMVLQQVVIVFMQRIFTAAEMSFLFFGPTYDVSWWSEELKLYNAIIVCLCVTYTFVQGGHVRVDLVYSAVGHRAKRMIDMVGAIIFMMSGAIVTWMYSWYFLWRHLVVPKASASDSLDRLLMKARALRWNVETIGFSPNGFNAYFLFKVLMVLFAGLVFLHAIAFFYRSYLEWKEGEASAGKYVDKDILGDEDAELAANIH